MHGCYYVQGYWEAQGWVMGYTLLEKCWSMSCAKMGTVICGGVETHRWSVCRLVGYMT